jgi:dipeptidyl aminopeptidase/acylaminoacyl peptidase
VKKALLLICLMLSLALPFTSGQDTPEGQAVELEASDGLLLKGTFWASSAATEDAPAVLLLHMLSSQRSAWEPLIPTLLDEGYHVLAIDWRGHGETGGARDYLLTPEDNIAWVDWLSQQPGVQSDNIAIVGASMGGYFSMLGCAQNEHCTTAVALSPADAHLPDFESAIEEWMVDHSVLLIVGRRDTSFRDVNNFYELSKGDVGVQIFSTGQHGTNLFGSDYRQQTIDVTLQWLNTHTALPQE